VSLALFLAAALSLPSPANAVRVAPDGWPVAADPQKIEAPAAGERIWWWSPDCAAQRLTTEAPEAACRAPRKQAIRVLDEHGKPVAGARLIWASGDMLSDLPETLLPFTTSLDDGSAELALPPGETAYVRVAGPRLASWWQKVATTTPSTAAPIRLQASSAVELHPRLRLEGGSAARSIIELEPAGIVSLPDAPRAWGAADRDGVTLLPIPRMAVQYTAWCDDCEPAGGAATTADFPPLLTMRRGSSAAGRIVDAKRAALADAKLEAVFRLPNASRGLRRRATSDASGRFALHGLASGPVQLLIRKPGYATVIRMLDGRGAGIDLDDVVLRRARKLLVRVTDRDGKAVAGAEITSAEGARATTAATGAATLDSIPADEELDLAIRARGFRPATITVPRNAKSAVDAVLSRGVRVLATLRKGGSRELAGAGTVLVTNNGARRLVRIDEPGKLDVGGLDAGTLSLEIRADGLAPYPVAERTLRADEVWNLGDVAIPAGAAITGKVIARLTGAPVPGAKIRALRRSSWGPVGSFAMRDWSEAVSGDDGAFAVAGLHAGPQVMLVEAAGFAPRLITPQAGDDGSADAGEVSLDIARELVVRCTPVRRCGSEAKLLFAGREMPWASVSASMQDGVAHIVPAGSGTSTLALLDRGHTVHERSVEISSTSDRTEVAVALATVAVEGVVTSGGRPCRRGSVALVRESGGGGVMPVYVESRTPEGQVAGSRWLTDMPQREVAGVDERGHCLFADLQPGIYRATYSDEGAAANAIRIEVPAAERFTFALDVPAGAVGGRIVDERSAPVAFASVELRDAGGEAHTAMSSASGEFTMHGIPPGRASLRARSGDAEGSADVTIEPPQTATADLVLRKKERPELAVTVLDPAGQPLSDAVVFIVGAGDAVSMATTDGSGVARLRTTPAPQSLAAAAFHPVYGWSWSRLGDAPEATMRMSGGRGAILAAGRASTPVELFTPNGIAARPAFATLGLPVSVAGGGELSLSGLPPGDYLLRAGGFQTVVSVRAGQTARVDIH
jgi:hypothetical protein